MWATGKSRRWIQEHRTNTMMCHVSGSSRSVQRLRNARGGEGKIVKSVSQAMRSSASKKLTKIPPLSSQRFVPSHSHQRAGGSKPQKSIWSEIQAKNKGLVREAQKEVWNNLEAHPNYMLKAQMTAKMEADNGEGERVRNDERCFNLVYYVCNMLT